MCGKLFFSKLTYSQEYAKKGSFITICSDVIPDALDQIMKYKENEDSREKFFEERTKGSKQVVGAPVGGSSSQFDSMFGGQGDLAFQRKVEKAAVSVEKVENEVVTPSEPSSESK
jgi:hypothetical protein